MAAYLVVEVANQLEMLLSSLQENHAVPLLSHEQTQGQGQLVVQQHVLEALRRLLSVPDLAEVAALERQAQPLERLGEVQWSHNTHLRDRTSALSCSPPVMASSCSEVISSVISMPAIFCTTSFRINRSKLHR